MMRKTIPILITLALVSFAGCVDPAPGGNETDTEAEGEPAEASTDPRIPPLDDPGWGSFAPDGIPRDILQQAFQRLVFLQEAEAAREEHGGAGTPQFNLTQINGSIGPLEDGTVYNANRTFPPSWDIVFRDVNWDNRSILFEHMVDDGDHFDVEGLPGGATVVMHENETSLSYRLGLGEGDTFYVEPQSELNQAGFTPGAYHVTSADDETIHLDHHAAEEEPEASHDHGAHPHPGSP